MNTESKSETHPEQKASRLQIIIISLLAILLSLITWGILTKLEFVPNTFDIDILYNESEEIDFSRLIIPPIIKNSTIN